MTTIYAIWFPEADDHSVYVGLTNNFEKRCKEHIYESKRNTSRIVYKWMRRRIEDGFEPRFTVLDEVDESEAGDSEVEWQSWFKFCGWTPKHQKGGDHQVGYVFTKEHRENMSKAAKARTRGKFSEETRQKMSDAWDDSRKAKHREYVQDPLRRQNLSASLRKAYEEGRRIPVKKEYVHECRNGHIRTVDNTYITPKGHRQCLECKRTAEKAKKLEGPRCIEDGCEKHRHARKLCSTHYSQWRNNERNAS